MSSYIVTDTHGYKELLLSRVSYFTKVIFLAGTLLASVGEQNGHLVVLYRSRTLITDRDRAIP